MAELLTADVIDINIEDELKNSYLGYAMSVIVGRALPDARDGLKPVHRRSLFAMNELGNSWNKPYKKSARIVGDVIGKYHPHGDSAVYDTLVRMAQPFSLRYTLVDGQGNFGSIDGDSAAAMRYTEIRMAKIAHEMLADLDKDTVNWSPNYDGSELIPDVFPTKIPNLLVNGSAGIAVGMATNIAPHNLNEVIDATLAQLENPNITADELMQHIQGPDFPTGGIINGRAGIISAYKTGKGRVILRAKTHIETERGRELIVVDELPYQVNKATLDTKINELIRDKKLEGVSGTQDESDKEGMRLVIYVKKGESTEIALNNLFAHTNMQTSFSINTVALVDGKPEILNLKRILEVFIKHRREVVTRRTNFELRKAKERAHILEGLVIALGNIDEIIAIIKASASSAEAKLNLTSRGFEYAIIETMLSRANVGIDSLTGKIENNLYFLSDVQTQAILDMRLHRLTGLEIDKLTQEYADILKLIVELLHILGSNIRLLEIIRGELLEIKKQFGDQRRTEIMATQEDLTTEDLIPNEERVVTISSTGYAKTQLLTDYNAQRRGGKGKIASGLKDEDFVEHLLIANSHATLMLFSTLGKVYHLKVYEIPESGRSAKGRPLVNMLPLVDGEKITSILSSSNFSSLQSYDNEEHISKMPPFVFMATANGIVKKTSLSAFANLRRKGLIAINLDEGDLLIGVGATDGNQQIFMIASNGKAVRFNEEEVRVMGRSARGVKGMRLDAKSHLVSMLILKDENSQVLTASEDGYGRLTSAKEYRLSHRSASGVKAVANDKNLAGAIIADSNEHDVMLITDQGILVRTSVGQVRSTSSRTAKGVKLINLNGKDKLKRLAIAYEIKDEQELEID